MKEQRPQSDRYSYGCLLYTSFLNGNPKFDVLLIAFFIDTEVHPVSYTHLQDGKYILNNRCQKDLITNNIWGIVIDNSGNVTWQYNLPEEIPLKYSLPVSYTHLDVYKRQVPHTSNVVYSLS